MIVCGGFGIDGGRISIHGHPQLLFGSLDLSIPSQIIVSDEQKVVAPLEFFGGHNERVCLGSWGFSGDSGGWGIDGTRADPTTIAEPPGYLVLDVVIVAFELFPADSPFTETKPFVLIFTKPFAVADPDHL